MMLRKNKFLLSFILIVAVLLALRGDTTPDTEAYRFIYNESKYDLNYEFLYLELNRFFSGLGMSFNNFLLLLTITLFLFWSKLTSLIIDNLFIAFISFLPFYGFYFFGITIRVSIAVVFCYLAIIILLKSKNLKGYILYYVAVLIASSFHKSALIFFLLPLIADRYYKNWTLFLFLLFSATLPLFNDYIPLIQDISFQYLALTEFSRVEGYVTRGSGEMMYSLSLIMNLIFGVIFIILRSRIQEKQTIYNFFLNTYLIGCFLISLFSFVTAGSRFGMMFLFFEFILLALLYESSNIKKLNLSMFIIFAVIINFIAITQKGNGLLW